MAPFFHRAGWLVALLLFLFSCHDAPRDNPFDPTLTPPVELQVALDDTAGTATLTWSRYEGQQPFREYRVLRKVPGLERVDTLAILTQVDLTTWVDISMAQHTPYIYRVCVVNTSGLEVSTGPWETRPVQLPAVGLERADFDSRTATAHLEWTPYRGGQFAAYQVRRRTVELAFQVIFETQDPTATAFVDSNLVGATEYYYQVVVLTQRGEEVPSEERSGAIHAVLATWSLPIEEGGHVRLYREGEHVTALVAGHHSVRLLFSDSPGAFLDEQVLLDNPELDIEPRSVATALGPAGQRFLSASATATVGAVGILTFAADGAPLLHEHALFAEAFSAPLGEAEKTVPGVIGLWSGFPGVADFDNVVVSAHGRLLLEEDFAAGQPEAWQYLYAEVGAPKGEVTFADGWVQLPAGWVAIRADGSWQDFRLETDMVVRNRAAAIGIGNSPFTVIGERLISALTPSFSSFTLGFSALGVGMLWDFDPPPELGLTPRSEGFSEPFLILTGMIYHLGLEMVGGRFAASVQSPVFWSEAREGAPTGNSLASLGNALAFVAGAQAYTLSLEGQGIPRSRAFEASVSEVRIWEDEDTPLMGLCLPQLNQVLFGRTGLNRASGEVRWPTPGALSGGTALGTGAGHREEEFLFPISLDAGPDGRIYVLDAGNGRIQVFAKEGKYITQWGHKGSGEGEFDFGSGRVPEDFAGSVTVDGEGYIYVADVGNKRIQKFAP